MFYNGWTHDHYFGNVLVFATSGVVIKCVIIAPGSMKNYLIAEWGDLYKKLEVAHKETGGQIVVDSEFSKGDYPFLIKSEKEDRATGSNGVFTAPKSNLGSPVLRMGHTWTLGELSSC